MTYAQPTRVRIERARVAVGVAFAFNGLAYASWLSRTPAIRDGLDLGTAGLGLLLLCMSVGAVAALPISGPVVHRIGPARAVLAAGLSVAGGLLAVAVGIALVSIPLAAAGLLLAGMGISTWDVAMNVEGADVERRLARALMPRFHAGFSLGTVVGAGLGAAAAALSVPVAAQLAATSAAVAVTTAVAVRWFLPVRGATVARGPSGVMRAWREPRTLLVGLLVLAFAFTEGVANDWLAVALVDGYGTGEAMGAVGFGAFVTAMTVARMTGGAALQRWGRVVVLRTTAVFAVAGLLLVVFAAAVPGRASVGLALVGALLWGAGASLGFPVGMSAAADDPAGAAVRVSVVSSIGYTAFLAGPPLVGFLGEEFGVLRALLVTLGALLVGLAASGATRPRPASEPAEAIETTHAAAVAEAATAASPPRSSGAA
jgi:predicted MFS family arabinose efflux permease